jgi:hypothetical protein
MAARVDAHASPADPDPRISASEHSTMALWLAAHHLLRRPRTLAALHARALAALHGGIGVYAMTWPRRTSADVVRGWVQTMLAPPPGMGGGARAAGADRLLGDPPIVVLAVRTRRTWRPTWCGEVQDVDAWNRCAAEALSGLDPRRACAATILRFDEALAHAWGHPPTA